MEGTVSHFDDQSISTIEDGSSLERVLVDAIPKSEEIEGVKNTIRRETRDVSMWRAVVTLAMVAVAILVPILSFQFLTDEEHNDFLTTFDQYATIIIDTATFKSNTLRMSFSAFSQQVTSTALAMNMTWPYVTIPNLDIVGKNLRKQNGAVALWYCPLVKYNSTDEWRNFTLASERQDVIPSIWQPDAQFQPNFDLAPTETGVYSPIWQIDPPTPLYLYNIDLFSDPTMVYKFNRMKAVNEQTVDGLFESALVQEWFPGEFEEGESPEEPTSNVLQPLYDTLDKSTRQLKGFILCYILWKLYFVDLLPEGVNGIYLHIQNTRCGGFEFHNRSVTWELHGPEVIYTGNFQNLTHNVTLLEEYAQTYDFDFYDDPDAAEASGACQYTLTVYPSEEFVQSFKSNKPVVLTAAIGSAFLFMVIAFFAYDGFQRRRTTKVVSNSARTNAFVGSIFPSGIRDRLLAPMDSSHGDDQSYKTAASSKVFLSDRGHIKSFLKGTGQEALARSKPIADFFPEVTVMFCDITGFTAWSSVREPPQVFSLLEILYSNMDKIAKRYGIFKVETVGDCYVAVAGLPEQRNDHAVAMTRFARVCLAKSLELVKLLEPKLGPDTGDLNFRVGLHSGPVTAGVLRGERARFQLFGDTMNTASRIEDTGTRGRIHVSQDTANLLIRDGMEDWVTPRDVPIRAKGKGKIQTYWLKKKGEDRATSTTSSTRSSLEDTLFEGNSNVKTSEKQHRLIEWHVDSFSILLKQIIARRNATVNKKSTKRNEKIQRSFETEYMGLSSGRNDMMSEIQEIIALPDFDARAARDQEDPESIELDPTIVAQLTHYITTVSELYQDNDFHNFEHASHVSMSVIKLLSRIVRPSDLEIEDGHQDDPNNGKTGSGSTSKHQDTEEEQMKKRVALALHDTTYGITSDPLTQFAVVFSALIHDVDHRGVPNTRLIEENPTLASMYKSKSVAEQNSVDLAWDLLLCGDGYKELRGAIYQTKEELARFRQLVVQTVLATDIADKELKVLRNARWDHAFNGTFEDEPASATVNRKATIVIEHLIQASDVAHTMQHWHVYRKWNERFFRECYKAYKDGRASTDPSLNWYKGEIGFFDFYIIPLAKKLKDCGVFGVSSDEYLNYAQKNREEWEECGEEVVEEMIASMLKEESGDMSSED